MLSMKLIQNCTWYKKFFDLLRFFLFGKWIDKRRAKNLIAAFFLRLAIRQKLLRAFLVVKPLEAQKAFSGQMRNDDDKRELLAFSIPFMDRPKNEI